MSDTTSAARVCTCETLPETARAARSARRSSSSFRAGATRRGSRTIGWLEFERQRTKARGVWSCTAARGRGRSTAGTQGVDHSRKVRLIIATGVRIQNVGTKQYPDADAEAGHDRRRVHFAVRQRDRRVPRLLLEQLDEVRPAIAPGLKQPLGLVLVH